MDYIIELYDHDDCIIGRERVGGLSPVYLEAVRDIMGSLGAGFTLDQRTKAKFVKFASINENRRVDL